MEVSLQYVETDEEPLWVTYDAFDSEGLLVARLYVHRGYTANNLTMEKNNE